MIESDVPPRQPDVPTTPLNRNRDFTTLWIGDTVSELGSGMSTLVFPLLGYALTHSTTQAALATTAVFAGGMIARLPAGALIDRWSRRRVLAVANLASALIFGVLAVLAATGTATIVALVLGGLAAGVAETFISPAASAAVRAVVPPEDRPVAYARMQGRHHVANLIGPPLGGALFAVAIGLPFVVDAATFIAFAVSVRFLKAKLPPPARPERTRVRRDVTEGLRFLWSQHGIRALMIWGGLLNFAMTFVLVAVTLRLIRAGVHPAAIGAVDAIAAGAGILGAVAASRVVHRLPTGRTTLATGLVLAAVVVPMAWTTNVVLIGALLAVATFLLPANNAGIGAYLASVTPDRMQGRLNSAAEFVSNGLSPIAPLLAGVVLSMAGAITVTLLGAVLVASAVVPLLLEPSVRRLGRPDQWDGRAATGELIGQPESLHEASLAAYRTRSGS